MKALIVYAKLLLILGLVTAVLAACQTSEPTPSAPLAALATSQPSRTPTPTIVVTETAVPTNTPSPSQTPTTLPTPTATATLDLAVSRPILSSQGQLAFIKNQTLFVETAVGTEIFSKISGDVASASWSPAGDKLLLETCDLSNQTYCIEPIWVLYDLNSSALINLSEQAANMPTRFLGTTTWSKSGEKILFMMALEGNISVLDLTTKEFLVVFDSLRLPLYMWELPNENLLIQDNWGSLSNVLHVYDFHGEKLWSFPNIHVGGIEGGNAGILGFSEEGQLLVILEPDIEPNEFATLYHFNTTSFDIERLATYPNLGAWSHISPDGQFVALNIPIEQGNYDDSALMVVDQNGRSYGQRPNSFIVDWRPGGGPVVQEHMADGQTQLVYWPLDGSAVQVFVNPGSFEFGAGKWSGDGRFFIYSTVDEAANQSHLYLWQPENGAPMLLQTAVGTNGFRNFAWLPDSTAVYFNLGRMELWKLEAEAKSLTLIASSSVE